MDQKNSPPAKKNSNFPMTKPINKDVMELVASGGKKKYPDEVAKAKERLRMIIQQTGVDPKRIIQAGKYAEAALQRPEMYQMAIQNAVQAGLLTQDQVPKGPGIDFQLLGSGLTAGRLTEELVKEGKL
jgi:hypothetical protein